MRNSRSGDIIGRINYDYLILVHEPARDVQDYDITILCTYITQILSWKEFCIVHIDISKVHTCIGNNTLILHMYTMSCHWNKRILCVINFLQTGQWSTFWAQSQQSWCPQRRAVFLGSVRQMAQLGPLDPGLPPLLVSMAGKDKKDRRKCWITRDGFNKLTQVH